MYKPKFEEPNKNVILRRDSNLGNPDPESHARYTELSDLYN